MTGHFCKDLMEHFRRQSPGIGVVTGAVIARNYPQPSNFCFSGVAEGVVSQPATQRAHSAVMGDFSQGHDCLQVRHGRNRCRKKLPAGIDFCADWFVFRRYTAHGIGNRGADQLQSIIRAGIKFAAGKAVRDQRGIKKIAGIIPSKRATGPIGSAEPWRESDDKQADIIRPVSGKPGRYRAIVPVRKFFARLQNEVAQARTERAFMSWVYCLHMRVGLTGQFGLVGSVIEFIIVVIINW